ncbi:MAG: hypothetical protein DRM99_02930 [Thermoplasmata archaeon]|nr:MAG: hypothetical protein FE039_02465 [Thermoplasmata archaeon]RLF36357.1 MAG: hypothetical protein DRM99_02930 [Thermoplasmata archaeon]RLF53335.1 MAG: hypothetical protein DRN24_01300 [Thermoplasmata archaeon]
MNLKKFNLYTVLSILLLLAGISHYIYWGSRYGVWYDIGIYSITIVLVLAGILGILITLIEEENKEDI